ncbi:MAG: transglycosylase domain-containing protein, partial [Mesosutterella sp.]|nr:transglycosylase domain-containing protein [Mesosutterella sp.]
MKKLQQPRLKLTPPRHSLCRQKRPGGFHHPEPQASAVPGEQVSMLPSKIQGQSPVKKRSIGRILGWVCAIGAACAASGMLLFTFLFAIVYAQLPDMTEMRSYSPKLPLKIWSSDNQLLAEYGEERRDYVPIDELPKHVKLAILAAEDSDFYEHSGVDLSGIGRALISNILSGHKGQGGSTI